MSRKRPASTPLPVIFDTDAGHDDIMALLLLGGSESVELQLITCVFGNQRIDKVRTNVANVSALLRKEKGRGRVHVAEGAQGPMLVRRGSRSCPEIHGVSGLDLGPAGAPLLKAGAWPPRVPRAQTGVSFCCDTLDGQVHCGGQGSCAISALISRLEKVTEPRSVSLIAVGPLTNIAILTKAAPHLLREKVREIVVMGGASTVGNISAAAEFNILCDPEAAAIVLEEACLLTRVVMVPLELTHTAIVTEERLAALVVAAGGESSLFGLLIKSLLTFFAKTYADFFGFTDGLPLHDPLAAAFPLHPHLFTTKSVRIDVETSSRLCDGRTVVNEPSVGHPPNVDLVTGVDMDAFFALLGDALAEVAVTAEPTLTASRDAATSSTLS